MPFPLDTATFPPYSGEPSSITCPKCGDNTNYTFWVPSVLSLWTNGQFADANPNGSYDLPDEPGFLVRQCKTCNHPRGEQTLDTDAEFPTPMSAAPGTGEKPSKRTAKVNQLPAPTPNGPFYVVQ